MEKQVGMKQKLRWYSFFEATGLGREHPRYNEAISSDGLFYALA